MKIALLTAAVDGDNAGDAMIESAILRLTGAEDVVRLPLTGIIAEEDIARANSCDLALICGTNLYQSQFMCGLTEDVVSAIRVPIVPVGIGSSAPIGELPTMDAGGIAAVRAIHRKCRVGSVRDRASYQFLKSIGIDNVVLTGCPVLFHGLGCPDFRPSGEGATLAPRARLLHISEEWQARQSALLETIAARFRPRLVLQSPYDLDEAQDLARRHRLEMVWDPAWQADRYIEAAKAQQLSIGLRLHFAMLSIAYGKPAFLVSHDSRGDEFAKLIGLAPLRIDTISDAALSLKIDAVDFPADRVRKRWSALADAMIGFLGANDLPCRLEADRGPRAALRQKPIGAKPRIAVLVDKPGWAYDHAMRQLKRALAPRFKLDIHYRHDRLRIDPRRYELLHICFWGEEAHRSLGFPPDRIVKEVSSHRWQYPSDWGPLSATELAERWLGDCDTAICTSRRLEALIAPVSRARVLFTPNGIEARRFRKSPSRRHGPLIIGWAGNPTDPAKRFDEVVVPACQGRHLITATGDLAHARMPAFYAAVDVYLVTSAHEGEPLTLIEAMAAGCFPVCTDVGIVPEVIRHGDNGLIVVDGSVDGFRRALAWCDANSDRVRAAGRANAALTARERDWSQCAPFFARAYGEAIARANAPRFRNDDVAWDSSLASLERLSAVFRKYGLRQVHGVCLNGRNNASHIHDGCAVEYAGRPPLSQLANDEIRRLSQGMPIAARSDLIRWLDASGDELALHGLYHTDYAAMTEDEQARDISEGLALMRALFPGRCIRYFIAPFNRTSAATYRVAGRHGLTVLADDGVHLEEAVHRDSLVIEPRRWYRYHHHRFYPESTFKALDLSIEKLDAAFARCLSTQPPELGLDPRPGRTWAQPSWHGLKRSLKRIPGLVAAKRYLSVTMGGGLGRGAANGPAGGGV